VIDIRLATVSDLERVAGLHDRSWKNSYRGLIPDAVLATRTVETSLAMWRESFAAWPGNLWLAEDANDQLLGFCCAGAVTNVERSGPFEFEIYALHVAPENHRIGTGTALLMHQFDRMRSAGLSSAIVWTMAGNAQSRRFYERNGGTLVKTGSWDLDGHKIPDVAYGWPALLNAPAAH